MFILYYVFVYITMAVVGDPVAAYIYNLVSYFVSLSSIFAFILSIILSTLFSAICTFLLHFWYVKREKPDIFLRKFYRFHFFVTYFSGLFSIIVIGQKTLAGWGYDAPTISGDTRLDIITIFFTATANNHFYKTFEGSITKNLEYLAQKIKKKQIT